MDTKTQKTLRAESPVNKGHPSRVQQRQEKMEKKVISGLSKGRAMRKSRRNLPLPPYKYKQHTYPSKQKSSAKKNLDRLNILLSTLVERGHVKIEGDSIESLITRNGAELLDCYKKYLSKRNLRNFCKNVSFVIQNASKLNGKSKDKMQKSDVKPISRDSIMEKYISAVTAENEDSTRTLRQQLLSVPLKASYENMIDRRLNTLLSKKTGKSRSKTKHKPLDALTVIQNLKTNSVADTSVAQTRVADWAVKVGVEAKILKTREKENKGFHQKSLWDWRGRIEHDTIECHPHERYVDYLGGKISSFWVEKQQKKISS